VVPPANQPGVVCSLAGAQAVRIDWSGASAEMMIINTSGRSRSAAATGTTAST
jgi:hypothetical protein